MIHQNMCRSQIEVFGAPGLLLLESDACAHPLHDQSFPFAASLLIALGKTWAVSRSKPNFPLSSNVVPDELQQQRHSSPKFPFLCSRQAPWRPNHTPRFSLTSCSDNAPLPDRVGLYVCTQALTVQYRLNDRCDKRMCMHAT